MRRALYFLGILDDQDVAWMMAHGRKLTMAPGDHLIRQGEPADSLFFVLDGAFTVYTAAAPRVAELRAGDVVGEISFVDARPPSASVRADVESKVGAIPRTALQARLTEDVGFAARFYQSIAVFLADRLRTTTGHLGGGPQLSEDIEDADELASHLMASIAMAGLRFTEMQRGRWGRQA
ncbi:MAG: cyclic nucleotide-binding domain-containing protein [Vicinamibacterales bacterium]